MKLLEPKNLTYWECGSNTERVGKVVDIYVSSMGGVPDTVFVPLVVWEELKENARYPGHWSVRFGDGGVLLLFGVYGKAVNVLPFDDNHIVAYDRGKEVGVRIGAYMRYHDKPAVELVEVEVEE